MQNLALEKTQKVLKENYEKLLSNQLGTTPSALISKIKKVPIKGNTTVSAAQVGLSGGFGFSAEGAATPASGAVQFERFQVVPKDMYVDIEISAKAVELGGPSGSMADLLHTEVMGGHETGKWNLGRSLFMDGTGVLTTFSNMGSASTTITVASTKYLKEGLIIDFYNKNGTTPQTNGAGRRIVSIDRANKTITIDGSYQFSSTDNLGFITVQNSFGRELTGLGAIFSDSITSIYGVTKSTSPFLYPVVVDGGNDVDDGIITKTLRTARNEKNSNVDLILAGDDAYDNYVNYLRVNNIRVEDMSHTIQGGFKAIQFLFGDKVVDIVNESFVPDKEMWGVDTGVCKFYQTDWHFLQLQNGGIFNLMEGKSAYRALLANYGDFFCGNPGGCIRITNCA